MTVRNSFLLVIILAGLALCAQGASAQMAANAVPSGTPQATINLATADGARLVKGEWRYSDTKIIEVDFRGPGADAQPTGAPVKTYDYAPHAGGVDFDDSKWEVIDATSLDKRRAAGRICFNWYRIRITVPERIGDFDPTGKTIVFETALDDYAEVWVDGELARSLGQMGGSVVGGWNAPNRYVTERPTSGSERRPESRRVQAIRESGQRRRMSGSRATYRSQHTPARKRAMLTSSKERNGFASC